MSNPCYYHPATAAAGTCVQCGTPVCTDCHQTVGDKSSCPRCFDTLKARFAQLAPAVPVYGAQSVNPYAGSPAPTIYGGGEEKSGAGKMLAGLALGLVIGIAGAVIIEKILFYGHFGLSLLYIGLGYGIGWGMHRIIGRGGPGPALAAVAVMVASLCVSHLVWTPDVLTIALANGNADPGSTLADAFPVAMAHLGIMHWVLIVFGLLACYRGVEQQQP